MDEIKKKRRIHYLVKRKFQLEYVAVALVLMFVVTAVFVFTAYRSGWVPLVEKLSAVYPQGMLAPILKMVTLQMAIRFLLLAPIIIIASIYLSHKVAGPLARIEDDIREIAGGDLEVRIGVRKGDEVKGLAQAINQVTENMRQMVRDNRGSVEKALEALKDLREQLQQRVESPEVFDLINRLGKCIDDIDKSLSDFKISETTP